MKLFVCISEVVFVFSDTGTACEHGSSVFVVVFSYASLIVAKYGLSPCFQQCSPGETGCSWLGQVHSLGSAIQPFFYPKSSGEGS